MKDSLKSIVVLTVICLVVSAVLAGINQVTAPIIAENQSSKANESLYVVLPDAENFEELALPEGSPETVTGVYRDTAGSGYAITLETSSQYSSSNMLITMGVGADGKIVNIALTNYAESKDFGTETYPQTYIGADSALSGIDTVAGVTYSSAAFKNAVADGFTALMSVADIAAGEKTEDQIVSEIGTKLFPYACNNAGVCQISATGETYSDIKNLYAAENKTGYIAAAEFGEETIYIAFDAFGTVISTYNSEEEEVDASSYSAEIEKASAEVAALVSEKNDKTVTRLEKMFEGAEITPITLNVQSSVSSAQTVITPDGNYVAVTAAPYGYGGPVEILFVLTEQGDIVRFKVVSQKETEYFGEAVAESGYASKQEGTSVNAADEEAVTIAGCTFTTNAVKAAYADAAEALEAYNLSE